MCELDIEPCEFWSSSEVIARKSHRCSCCGRKIRPGERYTRIFGKFEGDAFTEKSCPQCSADALEFAAAHDGMNPGPTSLPDVLDQCIDDGDEESERRWKPMLAAIRVRGAETEQ